MGNAILHRRRLVFVMLAVVLALAVVVVLPKTGSAEPPSRYDDQVDRYRGFCDFTVLSESSGHIKVRELPGGDFLLTGAGVTTVTNVDNPENQLVDRGGGSGRITPLTEEGLEGDVLVVARGQNFLFDPGETIYLTIGKVRFTVAGGPFVGGDINILQRRRKVIEVCAALEGEAAEEYLCLQSKAVVGRQEGPGLLRVPALSHAETLVEPRPFL